MGESDRATDRAAAARAESQYFDSVVEGEGDFNPFAPRGWATLRGRFHCRLNRAGQVAPLCLLEIGCGTGQSRPIYQDRTKSHFGIDLSFAALRIARVHFPDVHWLRADACQLPFADNTFDAVVFSSVLHHIPVYTDALRHAVRVLKPGGLVFAFDPNLLHPAMALFRAPGSPLYISKGVSPNERPLTARALRTAFGQAGLIDNVARGQSDIPYRHVAPRLINACLRFYNTADWLLEHCGLGRWFGTFVVTSGRKPSDASRPQRYSVVVPVFNEAENIGEYCRMAIQHLSGDYEVLICYDIDEDNTLPALAALAAEAKPKNIRLIRNGLGRGVRYAIEAGMRAAREPIVVVMMADVSDDFPKVDEMVQRAAAGAQVVCASRYMKGGRQIGGPKFKGFLSRMAGLTLHWFAGLPTHDPTNSFKAYRKDFLDRTPIESTAGFCLGLELTAKSHFSGGRVEEVPAEWHDRTAGQSRFKLAKWLPHYLHWYFWALRRRWLPEIGQR